jgi:hypothetical protein
MSLILAPAAVMLNRVTTAAFQSATDQIGFRQRSMAVPKLRPSVQWRADHAAQSVFERGAARGSDPDAAGPDRPALRVDARVLYRCKPGTHEVD